MSWLSSISRTRAPWLLLALIAFLFEATALYFQYAMDLAPCIMCIYQRTAVLGVLLAGLIGAINPANLWLRLSGLATWLVASIWGLLLAREHIMMQTTTDPFAFVCEFEPNFPVPLHEWIPGFFAATGDCGNIDWQFLGLSMPGWMQVIFAALAAAAVIVTSASLFFKPNKP
ncbi:MULTISPECIES: disulfide bond formation protein DsbB [unclassified Pseudoalteromonas]|uniref:disulfide bond formation protein DsbB n=1 Tax=unclassified Pseudoalteromonas TaxID=194690 RepID=UPI000CF72F93|nr:MULTISPECIES: disulfide bond formation protein DsbB [unclassified Pseudoalteromonas]